MDLMQAISTLEATDVVDEGRLLVLLNAFVAQGGEGTIEGLTKLAKLDFLLRYPTFLRRALEAKGKSIRGIDIQPHEEKSVESRMVRYRFGPWDHRYRRLLNLLAGKGLVHLFVDGRTVNIGLTDGGKALAKQLAERQEYADIARRATVLKTHFDMTATNLMKFIYGAFPEILSLRSDQEIRP